MPWVIGGSLLGATALPYILGDDGESTQTSTQTVTPMERPDEFGTMFQEFMSQYFGGTQEYLDKQKDLAEAKKKLAQGNLWVTEGDSKHQKLGQSIKAQAEKDIADINTWLTANPRGESPYKQALGTAYDEKRTANEGYLSTLTGLKEPYLSAVESAMGTHGGLLDEIVNKRMTGEAVGPYGADIDKLLGERTGVSFGGDNPMQFITGSQQRLLSDLLGAQETGLSNIQTTSANRATADILPEGIRYGKEREIADLTNASFMPSNIADLGYLQNLQSMWEPMEQTRFGAPASSTSTGTYVPSSGQNALTQQQAVGQGLGNLSQLLDLWQTLQAPTPNPTSSVLQVPSSQGTPLTNSGQFYFPMN